MRVLCVDVVVDIASALAVIVVAVAFLVAVEGRGRFCSVVSGLALCQERAF